MKHMSMPRLSPGHFAKCAHVSTAQTFSLPVVVLRVELGYGLHSWQKWACLIYFQIVRVMFKE